VRAEVAPTPVDAYWPNLLKSRWRLRLNYVLGLVATVSVFAFWTIPVAAVQGLTSLNTLAANPDAPEWLRESLTSLGEENLATISGFLSAMVLQFFLYLTLYSGFFQWLARMVGATSETEVHRITTSRVLLFELLLVLLASNIASSLFSSVQTLVSDPFQLPFLLAQNLPTQSTFFMHYILSGMLYVAAFDVLRVFEWLYLLLYCHPCKQTADAPPSAELKAAFPPAETRQRVVMIYAKLYLMMGIWLTFMFVAPMAVLISFFYFVPSYWIYGPILRNVDGPVEVDLGGECWEETIRYSNWTYHIAHVLLIGILILKEEPAASILVVIALVYAMFRTGRLRQRFSGHATALSLQRCVEMQLDAGPTTFDTLEPYATDDGVKESSATWKASHLRTASGEAPPQPKPRSGFFGVQ